MIEKMPAAEWQLLEGPGTIGVSGRIVLSRAGLVIANLKFAAHATTDEHFAPHDIDVICLEGEGFVSIGAQTSPLRAGERVLWPAGINHRLWAGALPMETLMIERSEEALP